MNLPAYTPSDRRPIAARGWRLSNFAAAWLVRRNISPNSISIAGMIAGISAGAALAATPFVPQPWERFLWLTVALLVPLRLAANMLDGMVAIQSGRGSPLGELFNEVPDRISDAAVLIGLGYARDSEPVFGFVAALLAVFTAYVRSAGKNAGTSHFYQGPMAKPHRMCLIAATCLALAVLPQPLGISLPAIALGLIIVGCVITAIRRLFLIGNALRGTAG